MKRIIILGIIIFIALMNTNAQEVNSITPQEELPMYLIFVKYPDGSPVVNTYVEIMDGNNRIAWGYTNANGFLGFNMEGQNPTLYYLIRVQPCGQKLESYPSEGPRYVYITTGYDPC